MRQFELGNISLHRTYLSAAATAIKEAVGASTVPGHADEQTAVVAKVGGPPLLRIRHQSMEIFLQAIVVQALEGCRIIKVVFAQGIGDCRVLTQDVELQLIGPPVGVPGATAADIGFLDRTFAHDFVCSVL